MSDTPAPEQPLKDSCIVSLIFLKFAMAGDMESVELIAQLIDRYLAIEWESPQFMADSEAMRGTESVAPPIMSKTELYPAIVHIQSEQIASRDESIASMMPSLRNALEALKSWIENDKKMATFTSDLFGYLHQLIAMHATMRDQLELLHADTSAYVLPELPKPPEINP